MFICLSAFEILDVIRQRKIWLLKEWFLNTKEKILRGAYFSLFMWKLVSLKIFLCHNYKANYISNYFLNIIFFISFRNPWIFSKSEWQLKLASKKIWTFCCCHFSSSLIMDHLTLFYFLLFYFEIILYLQRSYKNWEFLCTFNFKVSYNHSMMIKTKQSVLIQYY